MATEALGVEEAGAGLWGDRRVWGAFEGTMEDVS